MFLSSHVFLALLCRRAVSIVEIEDRHERSGGERDEDDLPHGMGRCVYTRTGLVYQGEFVHGGAFEIARVGLGDAADAVRELTHRVPKLISAS